MAGAGSTGGVALLMGRVHLGFSGRVTRWVLLVLVRTDFNSYRGWCGLGDHQVGCGLGGG